MPLHNAFRSRLGSFPIFRKPEGHSRASRDGQSDRFGVEAYLALATERRVWRGFRSFLGEPVVSVLVKG
jgi:hypothetical protein